MNFAPGSLLDGSQGVAAVHFFRHFPDHCGLLPLSKLAHARLFSGRGGGMAVFGEDTSSVVTITLWKFSVREHPMHELHHHGPFSHG